MSFEKYLKQIKNILPVFLLAYESAFLPFLPAALLEILPEIVDFIDLMIKQKNSCHALLVTNEIKLEYYAFTVKSFLSSPNSIQNDLMLTMSKA